MYKIAHIADTHIKNLKYHYEYRIIFKELYEKLAEEEPDFIVHCGDLAHTKTQLSPEYFELATEFMKNVADVAPLVIIPGNHDGNLKNSSRQDAITPIIQALEHPNIHFFKNSREFHATSELCFNVLSVFDEDNWIEPTDTNKINIAMYHGSISNCKTDIGWVMEHGEHELSIFKKFDYAMLGDIHKAQTLDFEGRIRYCGSTVQQNHGETNDKGFGIWEIQDKTNFTYRHIELINPKPFITIELTPKGKMPKGVDITEGARIRLVSNNNLPLDRMKRAVDIAKHRFKPESITFLNRATGRRAELGFSKDDFIKENLRDISVQERLITEYLKDYEVEGEILDRVLSLNEKYNTTVEENEEIARNINWELNSFEFDNLFNYGESNKINFENLAGIVGIFGKNYSGKSSIIDAALYTLFNSTSKNERKNLNVINQNRDRGFGRVNISIGDRQFTIERESEKYIKKLKGEETVEAKTDVNFEEFDPVMDETISRNGLSRNDTDKNIRKMFGTLDDFLLTSMASQLDSLTFIKEGSTKRKEILAKFLDLEIFDKKFKMAKDDAADTRGALKRLEGREFDEDIETANKEMEESLLSIEEHKTRCNDYEDTISKTQKLLEEIENKITSIPVDIIDINAAKAQLKDKKNQIHTLTKKNEELQKSNTDNEALSVKLASFLQQYDVDSLHAKKQKVDDKTNEYDELVAALKIKNKDVDNYKKKVKLLETHEYDPDCRYCSENKFVKEAYEAKSALPNMLTEVTELRQQTVTLLEEIDKLDVDKLNGYITKYDKLVDKKKDVNLEISVATSALESNSSKIEVYKHELINIETQISTYEKNREAIENLETLVSKRNEYAVLISRAQKACSTCKEELNDLYKLHGSYEQKLQNLADQKQELADLREEYSAYDLFMRCMHTSGISYDIIKKKLPAINEEIAKILANIVNFEVFFENEGNRLNVYIKHPSHEPRPIEMGSGAEKTIASMAIRLALLQVSNLPTPNVFIMDEPGTALDAENMDGFVRILDMVKNYYKIVILISHLDTLKDCVDYVINVEKENGYAKVNV
jgi:DNA repair exonuclease SbcCD ATPase subunit/DNA repair exonuclease SbcCD nuclease subunit